MAKLTIHVLGVGVAAPGLPDWPSAQAVLRGEAPYAPAPTAVPAPQRLPATERRRAGVIIKVSINVADEALAHSGLTANMPTVFSASEGDGKNCHELCEALASSDRALSPTRFTNSVHNAAAGYWHIATHSMAASTSVCAFDASFAAGLMEAALQAVTGQQPVLLVVADQPYPQPLHGTRQLTDACGVAMVLSGVPSPNAVATLTLSFDADAAPTVCTDAALEAVALALPAARGLALLERLAMSKPSDNPSDVVLRGFDDLSVRIQLHPVAHHA
jgi:Beta-ketoacyl synthase, N-terminal domain